MKRIVVLVGLIVATALLIVGAGCTQTSAPPSTAQPTSAQAKPTAAAKATEPIKAASPAAKATEAAKPQELSVVRVGLQGQASDSAAFIADAKGYFKEQGIQFQFVQIPNPPDMVPALATGQIEAAGTLGNPSFFNALASGVRMKGVADKGSLPKGNEYIALLVRKDLVDSGRFKGIADLKGMKVALTPPANASSNLWDLVMTLKQAGLTLNDVELTGVQLADIPAALAGGAVDAGLTTEPYVSKAVEMGLVVRVLGIGEVIPNYQLTGVSYSEAFMKEKPDVAKRFMVAYLKGARDYNDAFKKNKGRAEVIKILTRATAIKEADIWDKMVPPGINPDGHLNVDNIMEKVDWMLETGQIKVKPKPEDFIDTSYVDYALSVLGKYQ